jgi:murein DD-endopeptidase MepM/ murein hydrolase activator NlpD
MKFLLPPLEKIVLTQSFGENNACYRVVNNKSEVITPKIPGVCPVGYSSLYSMMKGHNALDLYAKHGQTILAPCDGVVQELQTEEARGLGIGLITNNQYPCNETGKNEFFKIRFWHLKSIEVKIGQLIHRGDLLGFADNTGYSSGDHLHFELKPVIQENYLWNNVLQNNGYYGAIDPAPYLKKIEIKNNLYYGSKSPEIEELQYGLKLLGFFPLSQTCTGYYGDLTRQYVLEFQKKYTNLSWYERFILNGKNFGQKSITAINRLLN